MNTKAEFKRQRRLASNRLSHLANGETFPTPAQQKAYDEHDKPKKKVHKYHDGVNEMRVGDIAVFGKNGNCEVIEINGGEATGRNLLTFETFVMFPDDCDLFRRSSKFSPKVEELLKEATEIAGFLKESGWTQQDFARALAKELNS